MSNQTQAMPTIEELIQHMKQYKDAVIIIGDKIEPEIGKKMLPVIEGEESEQEKLFTRKALVKQSKEFWDYYFENIYYDDNSNPQIYKEIESLRQNELAKTIISTDMRHQTLSTANLNLRGISTTIRCTKPSCNYQLESDEIDVIKESKEYKCPKCNTRVRPDCLLYGENYDPKKMKEFVESIFLQEENKEVIPNTHTLILIGVDMQEDLISEMYDNYLLVRERIEDKCYIVMITDKEEEVRLFTPEFATASDIGGATARFVKLF